MKLWLLWLNLLDIRFYILKMLHHTIVGAAERAYISNYISVLDIILKKNICWGNINCCRFLRVIPARIKMSSATIPVRIEMLRAPLLSSRSNQLASGPNMNPQWCIQWCIIYSNMWNTRKYYARIIQLIWSFLLAWYYTIWSGFLAKQQRKSAHDTFLFLL